MIVVNSDSDAVIFGANVLALSTAFLCLAAGKKVFLVNDNVDDDFRFNPGYILHEQTGYCWLPDSKVLQSDNNRKSVDYSNLNVLSTDEFLKEKSEWRLDNKIAFICTDNVVESYWKGNSSNMGTLKNVLEYTKDFSIQVVRTTVPMGTMSNYVESSKPNAEVVYYPAFYTDERNAVRDSVTPEFTIFGIDSKNKACLFGEFLVEYLQINTLGIKDVSYIELECLKYTYNSLLVSPQTILNNCIYLASKYKSSGEVFNPYVIGNVINKSLDLAGIFPNLQPSVGWKKNDVLESMAALKAQAEKITPEVNIFDSIESINDSYLVGWAQRMVDKIFKEFSGTLKNIVVVAKAPVIKKFPFTCLAPKVSNVNEIDLVYYTYAAEIRRYCLSKHGKEVFVPVIPADCLNIWTRESDTNNTAIVYMYDTHIKNAFIWYAC